MTEFAIQTQYLRNLTSDQYSWLREMCKYSNNLYNYGLYQTRQHFFTTGSLLTYESNYWNCKYNENYKLLPTNMGQQTLKYVSRVFRSFMALKKKCASGTYDNSKVNLPHYRAKGSLFCLIFPADDTIQNHKVKIRTSPLFSKSHKGCKNFWIDLPQNLNDKIIKEVRIIPVSGGKTFKIQYVFVVEQEDQKLNKDNVLGIDLGVSNFATCVTKETSFIVDGRRIKSINQWWNKRVAKLRSTLNTQYPEDKRRTSQQILGITEKRNRRVHDFSLKSARYIINYCITHDIGTVVCGSTPGWKQNINTGKRNNQQFVQIPYGQFKTQLKFLSWKYGIDYFEQEESYTSKADYLSNEFIPTFGRGTTEENPKFSGKRIKRGLYLTSEGKTVNADVNAAANIARKCNEKFGNGQLRRGLLASPNRVRIE